MSGASGHCGLLCRRNNHNVLGQAQALKRLPGILSGALGGLLFLGPGLGVLHILVLFRCRRWKNHNVLLQLQTLESGLLLAAVVVRLLVGRIVVRIRVCGSAGLHRRRRGSGSGGHNNYVDGGLLKALRTIRFEGSGLLLLAGTRVVVVLLVEGQGSRIGRIIG